MKVARKAFYTSAPYLQLGVIAKEWAKEIGIDASVIEDQLGYFAARKHLGLPLDEPVHRCHASAHIESDTVREFCKHSGHELPKFWFPLHNKRPITAQNRNDALCREWLSKLVATNSHKPDSKSNLLRRAQADIPGLGERAFDKAWIDIVPNDWKLAGAPKGKRIRTAKLGHR